MVGIICQVGRILLVSVQKEKVGFFPFLSSVLTGWSHILTLTAYTAHFGKSIAACCPRASIAPLFPAETGCRRSSLHTSALSLPAESVNVLSMLRTRAQPADEGRGRWGGWPRTLLYRTPRKSIAKGIRDHRITIVQDNTEEMRGWNVTHEWEIADVLPQGHKQNYNYRKQQHPIKQKSISYAAENATNKLTSIIICLCIK